MSKRIYIVDDEPDMVRLARDCLEAEGYDCRSSTDPVLALAEIRADPPDLVLLDLRMPGIDGFEFCKQVRGDDGLRSMPIIMVSAKTKAYNVAVALELGADDYIRKPYQEEELLARLKNVLRRNEAQQDDGVIRVGPLKVDFDSYEAELDGTALQLTPKEFELLGYFVRNRGRVLTRQKISSNVWGVKYSATSRTIDYHVLQLRKKLGHRAAWIKALTGLGYRFEPEESSKSSVG